MASIHVRLRADKDDDIAAWYEAQDDKSTAVREAIRAAIDRDNGQESAVKEAVGRELARLPQVVTAAVREALKGYQLSPADNKGPGSEDPELASRLDAQLDEFFS